uniref:TATA-box-binding protein n=1 Tax=Panagrellus redivivus TaxID=6233 RepID=A0A7E4V6K6_PANRE
MGINHRIVNVVATCDLGVQINLIEYASANSDVVKYDPNVFRAAITRLTTPNSTVLVFHTGRLVVAGAKSIEMARTQAERIKGLLKICKPPLSFRIQNIVTSASLDKKLDLVSLYAQIMIHAQEKIRSVTYEVEIFSGLQIKLDHGCIIIFSTGKIIVTGFTSQTLINQCYDEIGIFLDQQGHSFVRA